MEKKLKVTTKKQWEKMLDFMNLNPDIARGKPKFGSTKAAVSEKCEQLAKQLNSLGPPKRSSHEWQRVWINYKGNLKRKLANNRKNFVATGGGPSTEISLTAMEENVMGLINIEKQTNPRGVAFGIKKKSVPIQTEDLEESDLENFFENVSDEQHVLQADKDNAPNVDDEMPSTSKKSRPKKAIEMEAERLEILKQQSEKQNEILQAIKKMENTIHKNYKINAEMLEIKRKKLSLDMEFRQSCIDVNKKKIEKMELEMKRLK